MSQCLCPFLSEQQYEEIMEIGWEYDDSTEGLHFFICLDEQDTGMFFDVFREVDGTFTLYCGEFDSHNQKNGCEFAPQTININNLCKIVQPYLTRGFEHV